MKTRLKFSIFDLNFICSLWGFTILTSVMPNVESLGIRIVFLVLSLICLFLTGVRLKTNSRDANLYIVLLILILVRVSLDIMIGSLSDSPSEGKQFFFLFAYGVMFIPVVSVVSSFDKLNWETLFVVLHLILLFIILTGVMHSGSYVEESERAALNDRQDSSALGDYSTMLFLLSLVQLMSNPFSNKRINLFYKIVCIAGIIISFYGVSRGAARGAFVGYLIVLLYFTYSTSKSFSLWLTGVVVTVLTASAAFISWFSTFAPVLYYRMMKTVQDGDTSEREVLYQKAIDLIRDNPILPRDPIIIGSRFYTYHMLYLDVTLYLGVIGGLLFIFLTLKTCFRMIRVKTREPVSLFFFTMFMVNAVRGLSGLAILLNPMFSVTVVFTLMLLQTKKDFQSQNVGLVRYKL